MPISNRGCRVADDVLELPSSLLRMPRPNPDRTDSRRRQEHDQHFQARGRQHRDSIAGRNT